MSIIILALITFIIIYIIMLFQGIKHYTQPQYTEKEKVRMYAREHPEIFGISDAESKSQSDEIIVVTPDQMGI